MTQKASIVYAFVVPVPLLVMIFTVLAATLWWPCCVKCQLLCSCSCGLVTVVCTVALLLISGLNSAIINPATTQLMSDFGTTSQEVTQKLIETEVVNQDSLLIKIDTPDIEFVKFVPK